MASLRRSKVLSPDGQTAKFLYTIIKQLDLKTIDWNEVASGLDITNGHAARMRYSRFKAQIEGLSTTSKPRGPRPKKDGGAGTKGKGRAKLGYEPGKIDDFRGDHGTDAGNHDVRMELGVRGGIKGEQEMEPMLCRSMMEIPVEPMEMPMAPSSNGNMIKIKEEPGLCADHMVHPGEAAMKIKQEHAAEPMEYTLSPTSGISAMSLLPYATRPPMPTVSMLGISPTPQTITNSYPRYQTTPSMPPHATVSLGDLQLPQTLTPSQQMPATTFSYPHTSMDMDFNFNAPMMPPQLQPVWQPQFDLFRPATIKREV